MLNTQLRMVRIPGSLSIWSWLYLLLVAFPLLTYRIQWWIHYEAIRLWWKGLDLYPHPTGASNACTRFVETLAYPIMLLIGCCAKGEKKK